MFKMYEKCEIIKRKVKYLRLELKNDKIYIISPEEIDVSLNDLIEKYGKWIQSKLELIEEIKSLSKRMSSF